MPFRARLGKMMPSDSQNIISHLNRTDYVCWTDIRAHSPLGGHQHFPSLFLHVKEALAEAGGTMILRVQDNGLT